MQPTVIPYGKAFLVAGLHWEIMPAEEKPADAVLRLARQLGASKFLSRTEWFLQAGYAKFTGRDIGKAHYSLAAMVQSGAAKQGLPKSWIGMFLLNEQRHRWWMVAIGDNAILAESDFEGTLAEVETRFRHYLTLRDWEAVILPPTQARDEVVTDAAVHYLPLDQLLPGSQSKLLADCRLQRVDRKTRFASHVLLGMAFAAIAAALVYALIQMQARDKHRREHAVKLQELAAAALKPVMRKPVQPVYLPKPWPAMAAPAAFLDACQSSLHRLPVSPTNWGLQAASCNGRQVHATYMRGMNGAPVLRAIKALPELQIKMDGDNADLTRSVAVTPPPGDETTIPFDEAVKQLNSRFQTLRLRAPLREIPLPAGVFSSPDQIPPDWSAKEPPQIQQWRTLAFTFDTPSPPKLLAAALDMPALRIKSIAMKVSSMGTHTMSLPQMIYTIEGEMYAN